MLVGRGMYHLAYDHVHKISCDFGVKSACTASSLTSAVPRSQCPKHCQPYTLTRLMLIHVKYCYDHISESDGSRMLPLDFVGSMRNVKTSLEF